ncbi:MAG TPA: hypothetical protein VL422_12125 [Miltoncostaea sp.]|nr:hypothetical protein [Miltoncostaea sp.]
MASNLSCVGLGVADEEEFHRLLDTIVPEAEHIGRHRGVEVRRREDASGARIIVGIKGRELVGLLPSLASAPGVRFGPLEPVADDAHLADLLDGEGEVWTRAVVELEQRDLLAGGRHPGGRGALVAFGRGVTVHADADAFAESHDSLLDPDADPDHPPPELGTDSGIEWPLRMAAESFISYGAFGDASAEARLAATVLGAERRVNTATGLPFIVARVRMADAELDICLDGDEFREPPRPGQIVAGEVFLVASLAGDGAAAPPKRRLRFLGRR